MFKLPTLLALMSLAAPLLAQELPPPGGRYDSQLGGAYPPPTDTETVSRDRSDPPAEGLYNICYVNAFQTQPGETLWWTENHSDLLLHDNNGNTVEDPNWPGELLLDTGSPQKRQALAEIVGAWIEGCAEDGYQAIEADNLDTYARSAGLLSMNDNLAYARMLTARAAKLGLAFGQKNAAELVGQGPANGFSFAIVESCAVYSECETYMEAYGRHVLSIEYTDTDVDFFRRSCAEHGRDISIVLRDRALSVPGNLGYTYEHCTGAR
jgi:hypothetical protein